MKTETVVLFAQVQSTYKELNCDVYDIERNALTCTRLEAAIYHPPCRTWGRLYKLSNWVAGEHWLAVWSVVRIWKYGGVLEHPAGSKLWKLMRLPLPVSGTDIRGGFSISIDQFWFGHKCKKNTWIYIKGCELNDIPVIPLNFNLITHCISSTSSRSGLLEVSKKWREKTPVELAKWLIQITKIINSKNSN